MGKATVIVAVSVVAFATCATVSFAAPAAVPTLSGPMTKMQYLIGTWSCTTKIPAHGKMAAETHKGKIVFSVEPSDTVGYYLLSDEFSTGGYIGWLTDKKMWYSSSADNFGGTTNETGADSATSVSVMTGTTNYQGQTMGSRDTITKISDTKYHDLYEIQKGAAWSTGADSTCTKTSDKGM